MAIRIDQDAKKMLLAQAQPVGGFRPEQARLHFNAARAYSAETEMLMELAVDALAVGDPAGPAIAPVAERAAIAMWEMAQALVLLGLQPEAIMGIVRERAVTGVMMDLGFLVRTQLFMAIGPVAGEEVAGPLTAGLPIAGDEVPSYAVTPEAPPETPPEET